MNDLNGHNNSSVHPAGELPMRSCVASWMVALMMIAAVSGCTSWRPSGATMMGDPADPHWSKEQELRFSEADGFRQTVFSPTESVKNTIADLLSILGKESLKQPVRFEERRQQIERVIRHRVNCEQMAQRSLGDPWARLDDTKRQEFVRLFVELIRDTVANKIDEYHDEGVFYLLERREGRFAKVGTIFVGPKVNTAVDFRLEKRAGDWLLYDVVIDGASTVMNYRTQFTQIIRDDSYPILVERMRQKAMAVKLFERTGPAITLSSSAPMRR